MNKITQIILILLAIFCYQVTASDNNNNNEIVDNFSHNLKKITFTDYGSDLHSLENSADGLTITYLKKYSIGIYEYLPSFVTSLYCWARRSDLPKTHEAFVQVDRGEQSLGRNSFVAAINPQGNLLLGNLDKKAGLWAKDGSGNFIFSALPNTLSAKNPSWATIFNENASIIYGAYYKDRYNIGCLWIRGGDGGYSQILLQNQDLSFKMLQGNIAIGNEYVEDTGEIKAFQSSISAADGQVIVQYLPSFNNQDFNSQALAISSNEKRITGFVQTAEGHPTLCTFLTKPCFGYEACRWDLNDDGTATLHLLRDLDPHQLTSTFRERKAASINSPGNCISCGNQATTYGASDQADIIVGSITKCHCGRCALNSDQTRAMIWIEGFGIHDVEALLTANGVKLPEAYKLLEAKSITKNGKTIFGTASFKGQIHSWKVDIEDMSKLKFPQLTNTQSAASSSSSSSSSAPSVSIIKDQENDTIV